MAKKLTKEEIRKACSIGLSEDINGEFYTIYDFDKIWEMVHRRCSDSDLQEEIEHEEFVNNPYFMGEENGPIKVGCFQQGFSSGFHAGYNFAKGQCG